MLWKERLRENNYHLIASRYKIHAVSSKCPMVRLGDVAEIQKGKPITKKEARAGSIPVIAGGQSSPYSHDTFTHANEVITVSASGAYAGYVWYHNYPIWASDCSVVQAKNKALTKYLYYILKSYQEEIYKLQQGSVQPHVYPKDLAEIQIPLPPLEEQEQIVAELEVERLTIEQNKKFVDLMEQKIQKRLATLWENITSDLERIK